MNITRKQDIWGKNKHFQDIYTVYNNQDKVFKLHNLHQFLKLYLVCFNSEPQQSYMKFSCTIMCLDIHLKSEDSHINQKGVYVVVYAVCWATVHICTHQDLMGNVMYGLLRYCMQTKNTEVKLISCYQVKVQRCCSITLLCLWV